MWESSTLVIRHQNVQQTFTTEKKKRKLKTIISISFCDIDTIDKNYEISMVKKNNHIMIYFAK